MKLLKLFYKWKIRIGDGSIRFVLVRPWPSREWDSKVGRRSPIIFKKRTEKVLFQIPVYQKNSVRKNVEITKSQHMNFVHSHEKRNSKKVSWTWNEEETFFSGLYRSVLFHNKSCSRYDICFSSLWSLLWITGFNEILQNGAFIIYFVIFPFIFNGVWWTQYLICARKRNKKFHWIFRD